MNSFYSFPKSITDIVGGTRNLIGKITSPNPGVINTCPYDVL
jgi:hypothetical protein